MDDAAYDYTRHRLGGVAVVIRFRRHELASDAGVTMAELLVGLVLFGVVLGTAYSVAFTVNRSQQQATAEAERAQAVTYPLTRMGEIIQQNVRIDTNPMPGPYSLTLRTDQNVDDNQELHTFRVVAYPNGESQVEHRSHMIGLSGQVVVPARFVSRLGRRITNVSGNVPMFRYFDAAGAEITTLAQIPDSARSVVVTVRATADGKTLTESSRIIFRNRD